MVKNVFCGFSYQTSKEIILGCHWLCLFFSFMWSKQVAIKLLCNIFLKPCISVVVFQQIKIINYHIYYQVLRSESCYLLIQNMLHVPIINRNFFLCSVHNFAFHCLIAFIESFQNYVIVYSWSFKYKIDLVVAGIFFSSKKRSLCLTENRKIFVNLYKN